MAQERKSVVYFAETRWMKIEPPWLNGYRPVITYTRLGPASEGEINEARNRKSHRSAVLQAKQR